MRASQDLGITRYCTAWQISLAKSASRKPTEGVDGGLKPMNDETNLLDRSERGTASPQSQYPMTVIGSPERCGYFVLPGPLVIRSGIADAMIAI